MSEEAPESFNPAEVIVDYWPLAFASRATLASVEWIRGTKRKGVRFVGNGRNLRVNIRDLVRYIDRAPDPLVQKLHEVYFGGNDDAKKGT